MKRTRPRNQAKIAVLLLFTLTIAIGAFQSAPTPWVLGYVGSQQWMRLGPTMKATQSGSFYYLDTVAPVASGSGGGTVKVGTGLAGDGSVDHPLGIDTGTVPARITAAATLKFPSLAQSTCNEQAIALPGAAVGDEVFGGAPPDIDQGLVWDVYVAMADTVNVRLCKITAGSLIPIVRVWRATIIRAW